MMILNVRFPLDRENFPISFEEVRGFLWLRRPVRAALVALKESMAFAVMLIGNAILYPFCLLEEMAYKGVPEGELEASLEHCRARHGMPRKAGEEGSSIGFDSKKT